MKNVRKKNLQWGLATAFGCACLIGAAMYWSDQAARAQSSAKPAEPNPPPTPSTPPPPATAATPAPAPAAPAQPVLAAAVTPPPTVAVTTNTPAPAAATTTNSPAPGGSPATNTAAAPAAARGTNAPAQVTPGTNAAPAAAAGTNTPAGNPAEMASEPKPAAKPDADGLTVSFQGAQVDMVVQWLAEKTGKSVIKHPRVQCQLTIASSKKVTLREAMNLIYRALALEGFTAIESQDAIMLVPEGSEPKLSPVLIDSHRTDIPEGRQKLVKIFPLQHIPPAELREKFRPLLSDKGTIDVDDRGNQIIVTDYNDNLRLLTELVKDFDVASVTDNVVEILNLKHADAEELGSLLTLILNSQAGNPTSSSGGSSGSGGSSSRSSRNGMSFPPGIMMGGGNDSPPPGGGGGGVTPGSGSVARIWPDRTANRLIVSTAKSKLPEVHRLLDILDTDKSEDVTIRTIALKNVKAQELVKEIAPVYQRLPKKGPRDTVEIAANDRSNSLILLSSEPTYRAIVKLVDSLDTENAQEKIMQTFELKNADAQDVAKQLSDLNQDSDSSSRNRYVYYFDDAPQQKGKKLSVVADRRRNTVIVQAVPSIMPGVIKMVAALDEPITDNSLAPKIYPLKYVSATDIEDVLNELFTKKTTQRNYFSFYGDPEESTSTDRDAGRLYGKVRITSEPYSNTIILTSNSTENLKAVEEVLKQLDQPSQAGETTVRLQLRFAKASVLANSLNILFAKGGAPALRPVNQNGQPQNQPQQQNNGQTAQTSSSNFDLEQETKEDGYYPWLGGQAENTRTSDGRTVSRPVSDLVGRVRVVPDQRSNSLLVSANAHFLSAVLKLVEELDAPTASVLIEARIVEVSSNFMDKLGVRWSPNGTSTFTPSDYDNSFLSHGTANTTTGFGNVTTVNNPPGGAASMASALASLRSGVLSSSLSMDYLIQFLKLNTDATVLAEPQINIEDNELGKLFVGQQVPFINNSLTAPGTGTLNQSQTFAYKDVGVVLEVTPHINSSGDVNLKVHAESSSIVAGQTLFGGAIIDTRNFKTDLTAKSGDTLVLGGIIQKQVSDTLRKTPILGSIPGLKWAFNKKDKTVNEVELIVFLRPKVVRSPAQAKELLEEVRQRAPLVREWEDGGHGKKDGDKSAPKK